MLLLCDVFHASVACTCYHLSVSVSVTLLDCVRALKEFNKLFHHLVAPLFNSCFLLKILAKLNDDATVVELNVSRPEGKGKGKVRPLLLAIIWLFIGSSKYVNGSEISCVIYRIVLLPMTLNDL